MNKAILVIDMPKSCADCKFCDVEYKYDKDALSMGATCFLLDDKSCEEKIGESSKQVWKDCPLKEMPSRTTKEYWTCDDGTDRYDAKWRKCEARGYNACIDEILGGEE